MKIVDAAGRLAPLADDEVSFSVTGPGKILGVGNGDPSSHESDKVPHRKAFNGLCMVLVQTSGWSGVITLKAEARGLKSAVAMLRGNKRARKPGSVPARKWAPCRWRRSKPDWA